MKRVRSGCIAQTLTFSQKPESGLTYEHALEVNRKELEHYKKSLDETRTKYVISDETVEPDGTIVIRVKKQINFSTDVSEYF